MTEVVAYLALAWLSLYAVTRGSELRCDLHVGRWHLVLSASYYPMVQVQVTWYLPHWISGSGHAHIHLAALVGCSAALFYGKRWGGPTSWLALDFSERVYWPRERSEPEPQAPQPDALGGRPHEAP